jgi:hypothetical protein
MNSAAGGHCPPARGGFQMRRAMTIGGLLLATVAGAWGSFVQVSPATVEMSVTPGRAKKGRIVVRNPRPVESLIEVEVTDGWRQETGQPSLPPGEWFSIRVPKNFVIPANGERSLKYTVRVPPGFQGETMAYVFFRLPPAAARGGMNIQMGHAIPFYLSARGTERVELSLKELLARRLPDNGLEMTVALASTGNVHVRPKGDLTIHNRDGLEIEKLTLAYGPPIFPGNTKQFFAKSELRRWGAPGDYRVHADIQYQTLGGAPQTLSADFDLLIAADGVSIRVREPGDGR